MLDEDHTIELSFHHFHSLFAKSSKLYCNLNEPHMDIMYGSWNKLNYRRYCNLDDMRNLAVPHGRVKNQDFYRRLCTIWIKKMTQQVKVWLLHMKLKQLNRQATGHGKLCLLLYFFSFSSSHQHYFITEWLRNIYERTRIPLVPIYGGFPCKLKTIVGQPIEYDASITPQEMAERVADRMKSMIKQHQKLPGNITRSVLERFHHLFKLKQAFHPFFFIHVNTYQYKLL